MSTSEENSALQAKIISGVVLFVVSTGFGLLPFKFVKFFKLDQRKSCEDPPLIVNIVLFFGGGVLMATTFLHLLPDVRESMNELSYAKSSKKVYNNWPEFLMAMGFFLVFFIEEVVSAFLEKNRKKKNNEEEEIQGSSQSKTSLRSHVSNKSHGFSHLSVEEGENDAIMSSSRGLLIVLALSVHELFEGFAVGFHKEAKGVYLMLAAFSIHKFIIAFCIGSELMVQKTKKSLAIAYILIYSVVSAIGEFLLKLIDLSI